jgi:hypothetical protein
MTREDVLVVEHREGGGGEESRMQGLKLILAATLSMLTMDTAG